MAKKKPSPAPPPLRLEWRSPAELAENPANWRRHPDAQTAALADVIAEVGWAGACLYNERTKRLIDGHARRKVALQQGCERVPVLVGDWSEADERKILATLDPLSALAESDEAALAALLAGVSTDSEALQALLDSLGEAPAVAVPGGGGDEFDATPAEQGPTRTNAGELWVIGGKHRLLVGDCTQPHNVTLLFGGAIPDCILTDPPYCSGGFQEAGRSAGSIGTDAKIIPEIANDRLSTRGYMALIRAAIGATAVPLAYVFTDWRMWVNLFDVMEPSGFGVRNMIVWDKSSPGMGCGWRTQHELIMFASRASVKFDNHKAQGNVIRADRTGNKLHPTEKPLSLLIDVLLVTDMAQTLYDPFLGSGTTLVAGHRAGRTVYGCELEPRYADVILKRAEAEGLSCELAEPVALATPLKT